MKNGILILTLVISQCAFAQSTFSGKVLDQESGIPIIGAMIQFQGSDKWILTDKKGSFKKDDFTKNGMAILEITMMGYVTQTIQVKASTFITIELVEEIQSLTEVQVEASSIIGGSSNIGKIPGSATYLSPKELNKFSYSDPMRSLKQVAGVNIQDEEGFGLRPNIGMRGTGVERSSKITIMEDGVLMAPAPYAAPAAYFFPEFGRMEGVEILKGSSQIKYGPYTNGGVINFISKPIPMKLKSYARFETASQNSNLINVLAGYGTEFFGFSLEAFNRSSDGFKQLDNGGNTGFYKSNYLGKAFGRFKTQDLEHIIQVKLGTTSEVSNETYLGLTDEDFNTTPLRRYAGSQVDQLKAVHDLSSLSYTLLINSNLSLNLTGYNNEFKRNWYKLNNVTDDNGDKTGISDILEDPITYSNAYGILKGQTSHFDNALEVKANNRSYFSRGVQGQFTWNKIIGEFDHKMELGVRYHRDEMDRYQWVDKYKMNNGIMMLTDAGVHGTESNRIESAEAIASFVQYKFNSNRFTVIPGLRYEKITVGRDDYGKEDPEREGSDLKSRENSFDIWIPGVGVHYSINEHLNSFVGIHKGFSPPGSKEGTNPEESVNYEVGVKFNKTRFNFEFIAYFNDYENLLGVDFDAGGGNGTNDLFNAGEANVYGLEFSGRYDLIGLQSGFSLPLNVAYTYTVGTFQNDFTSAYAPWESVVSGDFMPYLAPHQLNVGLTFQKVRFAVNLNAKYSSEMRTVAGQGEIEYTESVPKNVVFDASAQFVLNSHVMLYGSVQNVFDNSYIVSRRPAGVRPGLPRWYTLGIKFFL